MPLGNKLFLPLGGKKVIQWSLERLCSFDFFEVIVVLDREAEFLRETIGHYPLTIVENDSASLGMGRSIALGVTALSKNIERILICLADMPFISLDTYKKMAAYSISHKSVGIIRPEYKGRSGHPVLFSKKYKKCLQTLGNSLGAKSVIGNHKEDIEFVAVDDPYILFDIDTVENFQQAKKICLTQVN